MTRRHEFPRSVKLAAWERCKGMCECPECKGALKIVGVAEYDHYPVPAALGGLGTLDNCRVLAKKCHRRITAEKDVPAIAKAVRGFEKRIGVRKSRGFRKAPKGSRFDWSQGRYTRLNREE